MAVRIEADVLARLDGVAHGFFTRRGGVSDGVYGSLNCGQGSKDDAAKVRENRSRVAVTLGAAPNRLLSPWQVHSPGALIVEAPWIGDRPKADALVTATPGLAIGILTADCTPVLFADPDAKIVGAAHAGWRGALSGVLEATIAAMERLGARPERIAAAVGPSIGPESYEVGPEFEREFLATAPGSTRFFHQRPGAKPRFDLPAFCRDRLVRAGIGTIEDASTDTYADESRFFSFRRTTHRKDADYGRQISAIVLK